MPRQPTPLVHKPQRAAGLTPAVCTVDVCPNSPENPSPHYQLVESRDGGRVQIYKPFVSLLTDNQLDSFEAIWNLAGGSVIRRVGSRETRRIELMTPQGRRPFFLKRFGAPRWRDSLRALLHFGWPIHGARPEWEAIWQFIAAGIPTVTPVACGEAGERSLLITEGLPSRCNLLEFVNGQVSSPAFRRNPRSDASDGHSVIDQTGDNVIERVGLLADREQPARGGRIPPEGGTTSRVLLVRIAGITRRMHAAGLHHQDYYLNHMLLCGDAADAGVHVIDLGRARRQPRLGTRWIIKDLSQLNFSARAVSAFERLRFLRLYLGRPFCPADRRLVRRIAAKSRRIAAHTAKHDL